MVLLTKQTISEFLAEPRSQSEIDKYFRLNDRQKLRARYLQILGTMKHKGLIIEDNETGKLSYNEFAEGLGKIS